MRSAAQRVKAFCRVAVGGVVARQTGDAAFNRTSTRHAGTGCRGVPGARVAVDICEAPNFALERTAGSPSLATAAHRQRSVARSWQHQVKYPALTEKAQHISSPSHIYVFVNLRSRADGKKVEFFVVPSAVVAEKLEHGTNPQRKWSEWWHFDQSDAEPFRDKWEVFGVSPNRNLTAPSTQTRARAARTG